MVNSFKGFLQLLKSEKVDGNLAKSSVLRVVCGNEAADFDSVASALTYAFCSYHKDPNNLVIPIINIPKADLRLRKDVVRTLGKLHITEDLLFFTEDLKRYKTRYNSISAVLVDHNEIEIASKDLISNVVGIIDHHKDENLYLDANPRIVKTTGSCSSLVFDFWRKTIFNSNSAKELAMLLMGAALLDTSNFQYKVEEPDLRALKCYEEILPDLDREEYYTQLKTDKANLDGLSVKDILKKDYKEFIFESADEKLVIGIASVGKPLEWLCNQCGSRSEFQQQCIEAQKEHAVNLFAIMTAWQDGHDFKRQILVMSPLKDQPEKIINAVTNDLKLKDFDQLDAKSFKNEHYYFNAFQQLNVAASRKQVVPLLRDAFHYATGK
ncbi:related to Exopolyphosphatase [Zygosaccharomyces bailii]|uniref:ZYBA0S10-04038g1_1 n=1 Tax=Zygosaccharomyces bailii (strain CLIB 213 / ATCC 58445 / CBS 680 / BCRC 21525 / NBRC 1098 / NCYC 1416 / NRRL Y-2227) TaxID=1333698 RepID=A0A8J2T9G9_ZYGB2|nr:ZYBA0S10-04038g1_1 [Zygosaccharomyces bailii CLIB 213]CDH17063.1 related to Exopolyphosphatase [Zygosaccharomyces bailii ISA1307]SJM88322.1 related to Exopolyphosphatase [Zygosaccharomyces bailii]